MAVEEMDALLVMTAAEVQWLTGVLTPFWQSPTRPWFVILPRGGEPLAAIPEIGAATFARSGCARVETFACPSPSPSTWAALTLLVQPYRTVGVPLEDEASIRMPISVFDALRGVHDVRDASALWRELRLRKSPSEIAKIARAAGAASSAFAGLPHMLRPGVSLGEAFRRFKIAALEAGADDVPYVVGAAHPAGFDDIISPAGDAELQRGDILLLDAGCTWDGYHSDFDRMFGIGEVSAGAANAYRALWDATEAGIGACRPGATFADLHEVMSGELGTWAAGGRFGHGLGLQLTEGPSVVPWDRTELAPGTVLTLEPSIIVEGSRALVAEEDVVVTEDGCRLLSVRAPRDLPLV